MIDAVLAGIITVALLVSIYSLLVGRSWS